VAAEQVEDSILVNSLIDARELPMLPLAVNQRGRNLPRCVHDFPKRIVCLGSPWSLRFVCTGSATAC
jgi:hypothetical protein